MAEVCVGAQQHAAAGDDLDAPAGEHVDRRVVLGRANRIERAEQRHAGAEAQPRGALGDGGEHDGRRGQDVVAEVVLTEPHRVEAERLGLHCELDDLAVALGGRRLRAGVRIREMVAEDEQAFAHGAAPYRGQGPRSLA